MSTQLRRKRVPETKAPFNSYLTGSTTHLETGTTPTRRGEVLGLTPAELDDWINYRDTWVPLFAKYNDPSQRTTTVTKDTNDLMSEFSTFAGPLLTRISGSAVITNTDRDILHLPVRDNTPTARGIIDDIPFVKITGKGGGRMKIRARVTEDGSHSSIHPLADLLEIRYVVLKEDPSSPTPPPTNPLALDEFPTAEKAPHFAISKKALFEIELTQENIGRFMVAFTRWVNASNPAHNGPWSLPIIAVIS